MDMYEIFDILCAYINMILTIFKVSKHKQMVSCSMYIFLVSQSDFITEQNGGRI